MNCELCHKILPKPEVKVSIRTATDCYNSVCRRCVVSSKNREELAKLEQALKDFNAARVSYHEAAYVNNNWVPFYDEIRCANLYGELPSYNFREE